MNTINDRNLTYFTSIEAEMNYASQKNYLFDLAYLNIINLTGEKSAEFLQGQISCDVREIDETHMRIGALCNLQGRILALPHVINWDGIKLILPVDQLEINRTNLSKPAMLSKVQLNIDLSKHHIFGFYLQSVNDIIPFNTTLPENIFDSISDDLFYCYKISEKCYVFIVKDHASCWSSFPTSQQRGSLAWHALQLQANHVSIYANSRGLFLPHRIGLQNLGYIHFNKGCYKGQEIIARMHYRATLKHHLKIYTINSNEIIYSGKKVYDLNEQTKELGEIIDYCPLGNGKQLIAASLQQQA